MGARCSCGQFLNTHKGLPMDSISTTLVEVLVDNWNLHLNSWDLLHWHWIVGLLDNCITLHFNLNESKHQSRVSLRNVVRVYPLSKTPIIPLSILWVFWCAAKNFFPLVQVQFTWSVSYNTESIMMIHLTWCIYGNPPYQIGRETLTIVNTELREYSILL